MITGSNADQIAKQLEEYSLEVERRLKSMVEKFATDIVAKAANNTPLGDAENFILWYQSRQKETGLLPEEGIAQGAWVVALDGQLYFTPSYGQDSDKSAVADANMDMQGYRLGDSFKIGNAAPYIGELEGLNGQPYSAQAPNGIMQPTLDQIKAAHEADLKRYYDAG